MQHIFLKGIKSVHGEHVKVVRNSARVSFEGNQCKRGDRYAKQEISFPGQILTTTLRTTNPSKPLLPVRSDKEIQKTMLIDCMNALSKKVVRGKVKRGQIMVKSILGLGINIIACRSLL